MHARTGSVSALLNHHLPVPRDGQRSVADALDRRSVALDQEEQLRLIKREECDARLACDNSRHLKHNYG
jgi:hypothetical protein